MKKLSFTAVQELVAPAPLSVWLTYLRSFGPRRMQELLTRKSAFSPRLDVYASSATAWFRCPASMSLSLTF